MNQKAALIKSFHLETSVDARLKIAMEYNLLLMSSLSEIEYDISNGIPDKEVWRNIVGYEGIYQISNFGRIKSVERFFIKNRKGGISKMAVYQPEQIRSKRVNSKGYIRIALWNNNKVEHFTNHRLVALHFINNPNNYPQVLHIDDNPGNPRWDNLEWGTQSKNIQDCADKMRGFVGSKNGNSVLTEADIPEIRKLLQIGRSAYSISKEYNIAKCSILNIKNNKSWVHVK